HQATALLSASRIAVANAAAVARRMSRAWSRLMLISGCYPFSSSGCGAQTERCQLLHAAVVLDQTRVVQRQAAADFPLYDGFQARLVDLAISTDGFLQFFRRHRVLV